MPSLIVFRSSVNTIIYPYTYPIRATDRVPQGRPKKERYRKEDIRGPRGMAAARQLEEPAGNGDDEV
jgi:hypothetical protein